MLINRFNQYRTTVDIERFRLSSVPLELQPLVKTYRDALSSYLADPENESWCSLGPNERYNALQAVYLKFGDKPERKNGNCSRCGGSGYILAYSHIQGGRCLRCDGTGSVNINGVAADATAMQIETGTTKSLREAMPPEFSGCEYRTDRAQRFADVKVVKEFDATKPDQRWPGKQKNVFYWVALANGYAVGWNENPSKGWSFPIIRYCLKGSDSDAAPASTTV